MRRHYVYYRVPIDALPEVVGAVNAMQARLRDLHPGLVTELLRRPELAAERATLMEVYSLPAGDQEGRIATSIEAQADAALRQWTDGPRHVERFDLLTGT